jgi:large subunit ribosomal protein L18
MPKGMQFARRRKGITNYRKRLALLKSGIPRAVVRFSNAKVSIQIIEFANEGDKVLATANSNDITGMGWKGSKTNIPVISFELAVARTLSPSFANSII